MSIKIVPDVVAPLAVTAVNLIARSKSAQASDWATYAMTAIGYIGAAMNKGGDFVKNIGVASLPLTAQKIYDRVKGMAPVGRMAVHNVGTVSRYPAPAYNDPAFQGTRLV